MSMPYSFFEARLAQSQEMREKSLAEYQNLMHFPVQDSLLKRLIRRLGAMPGRALEAMPQASITENVDANRPPAFSK